MPVLKKLSWPAGAKTSDTDQSVWGLYFRTQYLRYHSASVMTVLAREKLDVSNTISCEDMTLAIVNIAEGMQSIFDRRGGV